MSVDLCLLLFMLGGRILIFLFVVVLFNLSCNEQERVVSRIPYQRTKLSQEPLVDRNLVASKPLYVLSPAATAVFAEGLKSSDWMVRWATTSSLGCIEGSDVVAWLERRLADVEPDVRAEAISSLAFKKGRRARELLLSVQNDTAEELSLRVLAASALARPVKTCN